MMRRTVSSSDDAAGMTGCLVLLYAQPLTRIVVLTLGHVGEPPGGLSLALGKDPVVIPEPLAGLIRQLTAGLAQVRERAAAFPHQLSGGLRQRVTGNANQSNAALGDCGLDRKSAHVCGLDCGVSRLTIMAAVSENSLRMCFLKVFGAEEL